MKTVKASLVTVGSEVVGRDGALYTVTSIRANGGVTEFVCKTLMQSGIRISVRTGSHVWVA